MRNPPPKGKMLLIGSEDVEVYPQYCGDGHRCIQCFFNGKYLCAPRYWLYPTLEAYYGYPVSARQEVIGGRYRGETSLSAIDRYGEGFPDRTTGQPPVEMPDGGFVEEATEQVMNTTKFHREEPYRIIDVPCYKCGYPFLELFANASPSTNYRDRYSCPQCGTHQAKDASHISYTVKPLIRELREQGVSREVAVGQIQQELGVTMSKSTLTRYAKRMGLPPSRNRSK